MPELHEHMNISAIAAFLHIKLGESSKTQREIAKEIGYDNPNVLSMMKHGQTKVPFEKVPALAKALGVDVGYLMLLSVEQHWPGMLDLIKRIFGHVVSENEMALIASLRKASCGTDPAFPLAQLEAAVALLRGYTPPPVA